MKVVLFCGGLGTRLREHSETIPSRWSTWIPAAVVDLMRYYAHYAKGLHPALAIAAT